VCAYIEPCHKAPEDLESSYHEAIMRLSREHPNKSLRGLDIGGGTGRGGMLIAIESLRRVATGSPPINVIVEDQNKYCLEICEQKAKENWLNPYIQTRQRDVTQIPFPPEKQLFDLIFVRAVFSFLFLERSLEEKNVLMAQVVLENITKKLNPGGYVVAEFFAEGHPWGAGDSPRCRTYTEEEVQSFFSEEDYDFFPEEDNPNQKIRKSADEKELAEGGKIYFPSLTVFAKKKSYRSAVEDNISASELPTPP
jgi:ubiquinone/menaquinone biosynthesis C-methylase UbiE